ncbi:MAG TPA: M56 family metallopeptidase [Terriglobales bacterium]|nr:M56 family metallopeptidase [Terriglobales bacterium]
MNPLGTPHSVLWTALASGLADHLWQSTGFACVAALLTLTLRHNHARARYALWFAASLKFLVPFSWLVALGSHLAWWRSAPANSTLYFVEQIAQPFTRPAAGAIAAPAVPSPHLTHLLPALLAGVWLCGFLTVILVWCARWRRILAATTNSVPLRNGREVEALRRQEQITGIKQRVEMLLSRATLEPGIFGMARPVLIWPEGISRHLENAHLEAIVAHELWHVRRRDNLAATLHMLVEAVFWFHPLVWWLGSRLVDERERACDEEVLESGSERHIYAESILKVCEFCVGSPLACVSGVTGADLKKRMVHIMSEHVARKLDFSRKLLLAVAGFLAITVPIVFGLVHATPSRAQSQAESASAAVPAFESFSIKPSESSSSTPTYAGTETHMVRMMFGPDGFVASNITLQALIQEAYGVQANQISGGPDWLNSATFDVQAKVDPSEKFNLGPGPDHDKGERMLQAALANSTKLTLHNETKVLPVYALVVDTDGAKLQPSQSSNQLIGPDGKPHQMFKVGFDLGNGQVRQISAQGISADDLARQLSMQVGSAVLNQTGLKGLYDFNLHWTPDASQPSGGIETALQQQLGLKLEPQTAPMPVLVIDHIEKPAEN